MFRPANIVSMVVLSVMVCLLSCDPISPKNKISNIRLLNRKTFCLQYPSNWFIDTLEEGYDPDSSFTIVNPEQTAYSSFLISDTRVDEERCIERQMNGHLRLMVNNGDAREFSTWGKYEGKGSHISGKIMGMFKGRMSVFAYASEGRSFVVVSQVYSDEKDRNLPALELIESSFKLKETDPE